MTEARRRKDRSYAPIIQEIEQGRHPSLRPGMYRMIFIVISSGGAIDKAGRELLAEICGYVRDPLHPWSETFRDYYAALR